MPEEINYLEQKDTIIGWALIHVLRAKLRGGKKFQEFIDRSGYGGHEGGKPTLTVSLTIAGEEFSFFELMQTWESQVERLIDERAKQILNEKVRVLQDQLNEIGQAIGRLALDHNLTE